MKKAGTELNKLEEWCYMFRNIPNFVGIPKEVNPRFHKLMDIARINNMSDEERKNYFSSSLDDNEREDIAKAEAIAKKLLAMGLSPEQVSQATGLTDKEIMAIS